MTKGLTPISSVLETPADQREARPLDDLRAGTTKSLNAALVERLRADLLRGTIVAGMKLKIPDVCERYAVSPGVAREALSRLVSEGLIDFTDQRGFRSPPLTVEGILDLTRVRLMIEREALIDAMRNGDEAWESEILAAHHRLMRCERSLAGPERRESEEWSARHKEFHQAMINACTSPWLIRLHNMFYDQTERYRFISATTEPSIASKRDVKSEHDELVDAVINRDEARASALIESHLKRTADRVILARSAHQDPPVA